MTMLVRQIWRIAIWCDRRGQDMVEYALLAGFIAVAVGAMSPGMVDSVSQIYSRLASKLVDAGG